MDKSKSQLRNFLCLIDSSSSCSVLSLEGDDHGVTHTLKRDNREEQNQSFADAVYQYLEQEFWAVANCFSLLGGLQGSRQGLQTVSDLIIIEQFLAFFIKIFPRIGNLELTLKVTW